MTSEEIASLLTVYFENMSAMNAEGWLGIFAEDAVIHDPVGDPPKLAHKDSQQLFKIMSNFFSKMEVSQDDVFYVKNGAAVKWTMQVVAKNDRRATAEGISIFEINSDGKIAQVSAYWDEAALLAKLKG